MKDWLAWHAAYEDPSSALSWRLMRVRSHLADAIDQAPAGRVSVVSLCAGQGRDVLGVLPAHPRRDDVRAVLVEADARNVVLARRAAAGHGLSGVEVRQADAGVVAGFADALPADVLLLCGIFGNISDRDIRHTVLAAPALCRAGAMVIWTRHRRPPDLTPQLRAWFAEAGFAEIAFDALETDALTSVGVHRLGRAPAAGLPSGPLFTFLEGFDTMALPDSPDVVAPDGSDVRVLLQLARGGMAHFELGAGRVSLAVAHHNVDELWYVLRGRGQMWRRQAGREETVPLGPGTCVSIPAGTHFQFRCTSGDPLAAVAVTMPPWPGPDEAYQVPGAWPADPAGPGGITPSLRRLLLP